MLATNVIGRLDDLDREQLLHTARRLLAEADALSSRIAALNEIGLAINRTLDLPTILRVVAKQAKWLLDFEHCSVCLQSDNPEKTDEWHITSLFGPALVPHEGSLLDTENLGRALRSAQPQLVRSGSASPVMAEYKSQIVVPLVADEMVLGTINFASIKPEVYNQDDMRIGYMLALQLSSAIRNARNFAELTRTRDELRTYAIELESRNQELDAFGHTIAHDLKSPLNSIILKSELGKARFASTIPAEAVEVFDAVKEGGLYMNRMIDQLLWLSRMRNPKDTVMAVEPAVVASVAMARFTPALEAGKITLEIADDLPLVMGHAQWVEEIFANFISNAIKYMGKDNPQPRITIRARKQNNTARFEVEDTGVGISLDDQKRLFEMFTRLHTVAAEGLGLGLSIVQRMVTRMNGQVGVVSQPGGGSTFWFTLPLATAQPATSQTPVEGVEPASQESSPSLNTPVSAEPSAITTTVTADTTTTTTTAAEAGQTEEASDGERQETSKTASHTPPLNSYP